MWIRLILLSYWFSSNLLCTLYWTFMFYKKYEISWLSDSFLGRILCCEVGLFSVCCCSKVVYNMNFYVWGWILTICFSWKDGLMVLKNSSQHLDLLYIVTRCLRSQHYVHRRKLSEADRLLDKEWSCSMALLACAAVAVSQSQYAYRELEQLKVTWLLVQACRRDRLRELHLGVTEQCSAASLLFVGLPTLWIGCLKISF